MLKTEVYIRFKYEEDAQNPVDALNNRFCAGSSLYAELSPVTDFGEACCRQYENAECTRGGVCNFMHLELVTRNHLKEVPEKFGPVEGLPVLQHFQTGRSKGCGFVKYCYREDAIGAFLGIRANYKWVAEWYAGLKR
ncbi:Splicing factor U2AF 26 kDa subunit [Rhizophlyctis rosea]|nr:Splicing factor U2AF 26 kDa subunit [Rhizophlyctis rosea]